MTRPSRFLFAIWDGGGTVPPMLSLARSLVERGHRVRVLGPRSLQPRIEEAGCGFATYERVPNGVPSGAGTGRVGRLYASFCAPELMRAAPSLGFAEDLLATLERAPADALVVDFMLAGALAAAERSELPSAAVMHTVYCLPARGRPPFGAAFAPRSGLVGRVRDATFSALRDGAHGASLRDLNEARRHLGLAQVASAADQLQHLDRVLVLTTEAFDPPPSVVPTNVRYVGPQLDSWQSAPFGIEQGEPLVLVSFSSRLATTDLVQRIVDTLAELPVCGLVTLGPALRAENLRLPANVATQPFLAHADVLPHTRLAITHAGLGTVMAALAHGVPLLCIPLKNDQFENATRVVAVGAGRSLTARSRRSTLRGTIADLIDDPCCRGGARQMADDIGRYRCRATQELEELALFSGLPIAKRAGSLAPGPLRSASRARLWVLAAQQQSRKMGGRSASLRLGSGRRIRVSRRTQRK